MCRGGQHHGLLDAVGLLDVQLVRAKRSSLRGLLVSSAGVLRGWFDYSIFPGQQGEGCDARCGRFVDCDFCNSGVALAEAAHHRLQGDRIADCEELRLGNHSL